MKLANGEDTQERRGAHTSGRTVSGHLDGAPPPGLALRALREALVAVVSEPDVRAYLQSEHPELYEQLDEAMRFATGLRAVEHAAAERDRRLMVLDESDRALVREALAEWAEGRVVYLQRSGFRPGVYRSTGPAGAEATPWSHHVTRLLSHEEFVRWAGLPAVPKAGESG
jgi:hypothetical protein